MTCEKDWIVKANVRRIAFRIIVSFAPKVDRSTELFPKTPRAQ